MHAEDFYFYVEHGTGYEHISGNSFYGGSTSGFLGYPCVSSVVQAGFGAEWVAYVDKSASAGIYDTGIIPGGGEAVWVEIY
jgi:hypothetical protein